MKKRIEILALLLCLFIGGCGDNSKEQIIVITDYLENTETEQDTTDAAYEETSDMVNCISDYLLDGEMQNVEIPSGAMPYKRIELFQEKRQSENILITFEVYQYDKELYCKGTFDFSEQEYTAKISDDIARQLKAEWE